MELVQKTRHMTNSRQPRSLPRAGPLSFNSGHKMMTTFAAAFGGTSLTDRADSFQLERSNCLAEGETTQRQLQVCWGG